MLKLIIEDDEGRKTVVPFARDEITIGRQEGNTIRLTERNVSRRHARLLKQEAHILVEDLGSYNGVRVNGDRISGQVRVNDGDLIQIGDYDLALQSEQLAKTVPLDVGIAPTHPRLQAVAETQRLPDMGAPTLQALPVVEAPEASDDDVHDASDGPPSLPRNQSTAVIRIDQVEGNRGTRTVAELEPSKAPRLVVLNTDFAGQDFRCARTELRIGRTDDNDIAIDHRSLSRTHCKLVREDNGDWRIIDMQSANGLVVNGEPYAQVTLRPGDIVELGHVKLQFAGPGDEVAVPATEDAPPTTSSKAPIIAVVVAGLVIVLGTGSYALWKSHQGVTHRPDTQGPAMTTAQKTPKVTPTGPNVDETLREARQAIAAHQWDEAEALLKKSTIDGALHPEARALLAQMDGEKPFKAALDKAAAALDAGDLETAQKALDDASATQLLGDYRNSLLARHAKAVAAKVAAATPVKQPKPQTPPQAAAAPENEVDRLYAEGNEAVRAKNFYAAVQRFQRCIGIQPSNYKCHMMLGAAYAGVATNSGVDSDREKALKSYERYLELAPLDDPRRAEVEQALAAGTNKKPK